MVDFNRRFAPRYRQLKTPMSGPASIRMDKHRAASWAARSAYFAGRRFPRGGYRAVAGGGQENLLGGSLRANEAGELLFANHYFARKDTLVTTSMHRRAAGDRAAIAR